jgi:hypothetical protein
MTFNIKGYLSDLDREITLHRQQIAALRVRISELEDTRTLLMKREEYRAELAGQPSPFGTLPDGAQIVVREQLERQTAMAIGAPVPAFDEKQQRREKNAEYQRRYKAKKLALAAGEPVKQRPGTSATVERLFRDRPSTPLMTAEVMHLTFPHRVPTKLEKQRVYQALNSLKIKGIISQSHYGGPYTLAKEQQP